MKKLYSLKSSNDFNKVINNGNKLRSKYLFISTMKSDDFKVGISVPKKLGNAVFRNKNKRIVRHIIRELKPYDLKVHMVIILKKEFTELSFDKKLMILKRDLDKVTQQK